jgi:hypothetical protein
MSVIETEFLNKNDNKEFPTLGSPSAYSDSIKINKYHVDSINIYEITEEELDIAKNGSVWSVYLNIAISSISFFISFLISLLTCDFSNKEIIKNVFISSSVVFFIVAIVFFILWIVNKKNSNNVFDKVKNRKK